MVEQILPYDNVGEKGEQVRLMFDKIASGYDRLNRIMSLGFDKSWRKRGVDWLKQFSPQKALDVASGTGDIAILISKELKPVSVTGVDLSEEMMAIGRHKAERVGEDVVFEYQDCMSLTYPDCSFDAVTAAFGVRNFSNIERGVSEMYRVLRPNGHVLLLELSMPMQFPMNFLFKIYASVYIPFIGGILTPDNSAYKYLPASIKAMPQGKDMTGILEKAGFKDTDFKRFTGGVCTMYTGIKN
ncbi:MAG: bifunctional demethylmenaquinone methyltransferase/2-methoxy-6-polyprenyl-1,4-benzoquinol methylase UbiE [Tannerella sp.]|jgi:demethylmenaquinone methyltransferase/2-methoxy-6-polyprenyl-1,4-benzoquinol methylase|nr:bifunctional demethylmenaquinone methyltransferase/2-methoxy-6-polyprenyl-1,4-benzoquinol methylase UbiE [Tannerella sp.]